MINPRTFFKTSYAEGQVIARLHRTTQHRNTTNSQHRGLWKYHGIRTHVPTVREVQGGTRLRPRGHSEQPYIIN
jgi:hypothetical protein